jgi:aspartate/methionine/tyrosine aminotransferase
MMTMRQYQSYQGLPELRQGIADFYLNIMVLQSIHGDFTFTGVEGRDYAYFDFLF